MLATMCVWLAALFSHGAFALPAAPDLLLEAQLEPARVQVQTEAVYRLRFYQGIDVRDLAISGPSARLADFRLLGADRVYEAARDGRRYRVRERRYAVFPFASGELDITGAHVTGRIADAAEKSPGGRRALRINAAPQRLTVLPLAAPPPAITRAAAPVAPPMGLLACAALLGLTAMLIWRRRAGMLGIWRLRRACRRGRTDIVRDELLAWIARHRQQRTPLCLGAVAEALGDTAARRAIDQLECNLYGRETSLRNPHALAKAVRQIKHGVRSQAFALNQLSR